MRIHAVYGVGKKQIAGHHDGVQVLSRKVQALPDVDPAIEEATSIEHSPQSIAIEDDTAPRITDIALFPEPIHIMIDDLARGADVP